MDSACSDLGWMQPAWHSRRLTGAHGDRASHGRQQCLGDREGFYLPHSLRNQQQIGLALYCAPGHSVQAVDRSIERMSMMSCVENKLHRPRRWSSDAHECTLSK